MKCLLTLLTIMTTTTFIAQDIRLNDEVRQGKATTVKKTFNRETSVSILIDSDAPIVWALLTNASDYPRWNSTVTSIEGNIKEGQKIRLKSTLDAKRTFKLKVKEFEPEKTLVWGDGMGKRTFSLKKIDGEKLLFSMTEKIGGPMFPLFANKIPSFDESFEQFVADLKKEAELISNTKN
ncbi:MAG: SRPBCC family protein [Aurantibacter sp.]